MKNSDEIFKIIAKKYAEKDGEELKKLAEELNSKAMDTSNLDYKNQKRFKKEKQKKIYYIASSIASCAALFIIFVAIGLIKLPMNPNGTGEKFENSTSNIKYEITKLSAKLPVGFAVSNAEQDSGKTIFYIENDSKNKIVLETESSNDQTITYGLKKFNLAGTIAYGISKSDYSLITFKFGDTNYKITSPYDANDLIAIGESLIRMK